jgi:GNAT superfamily N-acetyltransferase
VRRYFRFLGSGRAATAYSIGRYGDWWHSRIRLAKAFVSPAVLLSGLLSRFDSDWERFLSRYREVLSGGGRGDVSPDELYGVFSWLLWGPSREVPWKNGEWDGLCMAAYGDENNSVPLFAHPRSGVREILSERFAASNGFGFPFSVDLFLLPKDSFLSSFRFELDARNEYFLGRISENHVLPFVPVLERAAPAPPRVAETCYSSAYLWLLFERTGDSGTFRPERSVAFFEHANLADPEVVEFLGDRLLDKAFAHFAKVAGDPSRSGRGYRFVCAMNTSLEEAFRKRFEKAADAGTPFADWLRAHVDPVPGRDVSSAFHAFDEFFDGGVTFLSVDAGKPRDRALLSLFHVGVYTEAFPNEDERETLPNLLHYLEESGGTENWDFRVVLALGPDDEIAGGAVFDYFADVNATVVEFLCVDGKFRKTGIGSRLWEQVVGQSDELARRHGKTRVSEVYCEVDSPGSSPDRRLGHLKFWKGKGFRRLGFDYVQPALSADTKPVEGLWLLCLPRTGARYRNAVDARRVEGVVRDYVRYAMGIRNPDRNEVFRKMKDSLRGASEVGLVEFETETGRSGADAASGTAGR